MRALILGLLAALATASLAQAHGGHGGFRSRAHRHSHMHSRMGWADEGQAIGHPVGFHRPPQDRGFGDHTGYHYIDARSRHERPHGFHASHSHHRHGGGRHGAHEMSHRHRG